MDTPTTPPSVWPWRLLAALLILGAAALHIAYLVGDCPLDLAPDEAHYWDWSRHLDWSYYSKGPLVAYLIRGSVDLFGDFARDLTGHETLAVRLPAVVCGSLLLLGLYVLTVQVFGRERLAAFAVAIALPLPLITAGSTLMTIDSPYTCCWTWALVLAHRAVFRGSPWAWPAAGLVVGVGILAKYTMVLFVPSLFLFLLATSAHRRLLFRPGFWCLCVVGAACCLPILVWNVQHDWVSLRHVGGQAGVEGHQGWRPLGPLVFVGVQFGLLFGFWFASWAMGLWAHRPWASTDDGARYLWWLSAPMFLLFLGFSLRTAGEPNWPVAAYLSGLVLAAAWLAERWRTADPARRLRLGAAMATAAILGTSVTLLMHRTELAQPVLLRLAGPATEERPLPLRRFDPTSRLRGWRKLAAEVDRARTELAARGIEPVLAGTWWNIPGEVGFYCNGHPIVFSVGPGLGDRHSQYDLWRPNPIDDIEAFRGRTFLLAGDCSLIFLQAFETVEPPRPVVYTERGQPVARWWVTIAHGFKGFPPVAGSDGRRF